MYTHPSAYDEIDTLENLDEKNIKVGISHLGLIVDIFGNASPDTTLGIYGLKQFSAKKNILFKYNVSVQEVCRKRLYQFHLIATKMFSSALLSTVTFPHWNGSKTNGYCR